MPLSPLISNDASDAAICRSIGHSARIASPRLAEQVVERLRVRDGAPEFLDPDVQAAVVRGARDGETERVLCW